MLNSIPDRVARRFIENRGNRYLGQVRLYEPDENGCWIWQRAVAKNGYGAIGWADIRTVAHRAAYIAFNGPIDEHLEVDHLCSVRLCVNPDHLELVTGVENNLRGNPRKTHCIRGHLMDEANVRMYRGARHCRACKGARRRERAARKLPPH